MGTWVGRVSALVVAVACGCGAARVQAGGTRPERGVVASDGPSVRAVTVGPVVIHAFSAFAGGEMFTAPATTGTDADCAKVRAAGAAHEATIAPDRRLVFEAGAGETVCIATSRWGGFELLWHAVGTRAATPDPVLAATSHRGAAP